MRLLVHLGKHKGVTESIATRDDSDRPVGERSFVRKTGRKTRRKRRKREKTRLIDRKNEER
jgi:hypothetical protein